MKTKKNINLGFFYYGCKFLAISIIPSKNRLSTSLENDETELGMSALDLLDEPVAMSEISNLPLKAFDRTKSKNLHLD